MFVFIIDRISLRLFIIHFLDTPLYTMSRQSSFCSTLTSAVFWTWVSLKSCSSRQDFTITHAVISSTEWAVVKHSTSLFNLRSTWDDFRHMDNSSELFDGQHWVHPQFRVILGAETTPIQAFILIGYQLALTLRCSHCRLTGLTWVREMPLSER